MVCPGTLEAFEDGDQLEVDIDSGVVKNLTSGKQLKAEALPPNIQHILKSGGLVGERREHRHPCNPVPSILDLG